MSQSKRVEVYTQPDCPPCQIVKQFLDHHKIEYKVFDVSKDANARSKMINELKSYSTPTVTVDGEIAAGFDLQKLEKLLEIS
ncbi:glutaredoxin domain-containing protein [Peribacillus frigoritolerans]|uniref:glutaredoxin domain-containing protein n=1 Tax=Peribacillus frigoritolerans TaxID=450367 RepID=UPI00105A5089|nr:glutaredoxin domain-containing protein [Peribacillus frigoritolerans]TDL80128.1 NrdH-redoxin [Peribacillus frigoritolerans]